MKSLVRLAKYIKPYWPMFVLGILCGILIQLVALGTTYLLKQATDSIASGNVRLLTIVVLCSVGVYLFKGLFGYGESYLVAWVGQRVIFTLRNQIYTQLQKLSLSFFDRQRTGQLISRVTNDMMRVETGITIDVINLISAPIIIIGGTGYAFYINWQLALISIICLPAIALFITKAGQRMKKVTSLIQIKLADITTILEETLTGIKVVKSFAMEPHEISRFVKESRATLKASMRAAWLRAILPPAIEIVGALGFAFIVWYGGRQAIYSKTFTIGSLFQFGYLLTLIANSARGLGNVNLTTQQTLAAAERSFEILDIKPEVEELPDALEMPKVKGYVEFANVSFSYDDEIPVLKDISFKCRPGEVIALVGPSGVGKTTLVNLIPRFYDTTKGKILIDDYNVRDVKLDSLRKQIGLVPQETILFGGTVRENIAYGDMDATEKRIIEAAKAANAHDFITGLPKKYDTVVGERGTKLSGGERQRIAIARAILKDPKILILDEATSALDAESEALVQHALDNLMRNRTTFVIAHRLSTIRGADRILVIDEGKIVEEGTHSELIAREGLYKRLYRGQFREEAITTGK